MTQKSNEDNFTDLLAELMRSAGGKVHTWEILVIYPVANQSQILVRGIREAVDAKNYICAASLLRSLIESSMALVYSLTIPKNNEDEFYKQLAENGRLRRWSKGKKSWENVRDVHLIEQFEKATKLKVENIYNKLCDILHFSTAHMQMLGAGSDENIRMASLKISEAGPDMSQGEYDILLELTNDLMYVIKRYIAAEVHLKRSGHGESVSEIANRVIDIGLVTHAYSN